ncbi:hypothetical protein [uncultured Deefgea sp.]|uniref:hypothetical protein n=1 Tax=uncultured Deefgea sp. TaxID=1304914 RepID=UPI00260A4E55|nr:hypothetical protein [uncultured Deefgea sp.]
MAKSPDERCKKLIKIKNEVQRKRRMHLICDPPAIACGVYEIAPYVLWLGALYQGSFILT